MQGLKKNSLSAWLMHPKNKVMDASLGSSGNADKRDNSVELTSGAYDDAIYESISPSKLTTASSEVLSNANTALTELTAASSARFQMANTTLTELAAGKPTADGPTTEICDQSKVKKVTYAESCNESSKIKRIVYLIISSFTFRIFAILLIFLDMAFIIKDVIFLSGTTHISLESRSISFAIALFFFMDVSLRVFIEGIRPYFSDIFNSLDAAIIIVTLLVDIAYLFYDSILAKIFPRLRIVLRPVRLVILIRVFHLAHQKRHLEMLTRRMVSGNKRRYKKDGFDLDLTYVTERIIAMSFPSSGKQSFYRNPIKEVVRFLDTKHPNHYQVYNLCSERAYDPKYFHHRVHRYLIDDHNVPSLSEMLAFSMEVKEWMAQDKDNIIVVHCKGGKGRTGTMVCAYLLASEIFATAEDSLYYFGERRTDKSTSSKFQGIETPSQNRFVGYFAMVKNIYNLTLPPIKKLTIKKIVIYSIHGVGKGNGHDLKVQIIMQRKTVFFCSASKNCRIFHDAETDRVILLLSKCPPLYDEVKVKFFSSSALPKYYENCAFFFWFHMSFIRNNRLYLSRSELDNPHKIKAWKAYSPQFAVEVYFDDI
ncbi:phosphatidylinositol 3,4,5-trisphosphate 3-phosphatase TPTE2-like isoform X4 [Bubalus kerabau]|uniref:phosphatidylinositol 3,4,5-trisphosphate 3-phosphatase TPTE2 isoform X5 n=1 Tax=Bubalus bubalis TaxID=89462 RepID=UPI001E1B9A2B|nr:phosphatidylinositol 3,4,5-trisphosphate 3-phosphatase TPTE2 isoform X5 [Bubalus bubalis]XP_055398227.1 phosphatidylinositol 3,4,5-trisphosphate 3-phosphatase TPTE2-like isoform X4 [Bubalus carabanensis]